MARDASAHSRRKPKLQVRELGRFGKRGEFSEVTAQATRKADKPFWRFGSDARPERIARPARQLTRRLADQRAVLFGKPIGNRLGAL